MRNRTWPDWILAVLLSSKTRTVVIADGNPRFCGKVLVDQDQSRVGLAGGTCLAERGGQDLVGGLELLPPGLEVASLLPGDVCG